MAKILYVFVDESGNHSSGAYYTVAGCWCVSTETDCNRVLQSTADRLKAFGQKQRDSNQPISELKGSGLAPPVLDVLIACIEDFSYDDGTLAATNLPWEVAYPIRYSVVQIHSELGREAIGGTMNADPDAPETLQTISLIRVLDPIFHGQIVSSTRFDRVNIVLDSTTWEQTASTLEYITSGVPSVPSDISFEIRDSQKTPGIQLADLGAYSWARHRRHGDCAAAVECLHRLRFAHH